MLLTLDDYEGAAYAALLPEVAAFIREGAGGSRSVRRNLDAFERVLLKPRRFTDVSEISTATRVLGRQVDAPVLIAPTGLQTLAHPDGELATARAASRARTVAPAASLATYPVERIVDAASDTPVWFQLYDYGQDVVDDLVERATRAGCAAICVTVDVPRRTRMREHDRRGGFRPTSRAVPAHFAASPPPVRPVTLPTLERICASTTLPVIVKGVLRAADAELAVEAGATGIVVSNHGGRESGSVPASLDVLAEIAAAVGDRAEVFLDGGVRTGDDVVKALCLGARAVLIGRPSWWGLVIDGEDGVFGILEILREELIETLAQIGCADIRHLDGGFLHG